MIFDAVILAGGKSSRMGRDKAWLEVGGRPLVLRQIELVRRLKPRRLYLSGNSDGPLAGLGLPVLADAFQQSGPLAGIERALLQAKDVPLLVLAVDMPHMSLRCLRYLMRHCAQWRGAVPQLDGRLEPLAAVYPAAAWRLAHACLSENCLCVQSFAEICHADKLVTFFEWPAASRECLSNWNRPEDVMLSGD